MTEDNPITEEVLRVLGTLCQELERKTKYISYNILYMNIQYNVYICVYLERAQWHFKVYVFLLALQLAFSSWNQMS